VDAGHRCTVPDRVVVLGQARRGGSVERVEFQRPCRGVNWDGLWWWSRPDGVLQIQPLSRLAKNPELLAPYQVSSPLCQTNPTLMVQPLVPRTAEVAGAADASPLVSVVGAAWLLMCQPTVAATRALEASSQARKEGASATTGPDPDRVSIIELRRPMSPPREQHDSSSERQYHHRWWGRRALAPAGVRPQSR
jgi:hypothetical protein